MLNEDFNIDQFKKSWQEQPVSDVYNTSEIEGMLNKNLPTMWNIFSS